MELIVIRHATTKYNSKGLINGQHDDQLSPEGLNELPILVNKLKPYKFNIIYTSPLKRALQTSKAIVAARNTNLKVDPRLMEVNFGSFTSENWDSLKTVFGLNSRDLLDSYKYDLQPYGGESAEQVKARVLSFLTDISKQPNQKPVIVTHGGIIRWIYLLTTNQKTSYYPNSSINLVTLKPNNFKAYHDKIY